MCRRALCAHTACAMVRAARFSLNVELEVCSKDTERKHFQRGNKKGRSQGRRELTLQQRGRQKHAGVGPQEEAKATAHAERPRKKRTPPFRDHRETRRGERKRPGQRQGRERRADERQTGGKDADDQETKRSRWRSRQVLQHRQQPNAVPEPLSNHRGVGRGDEVWRGGQVGSGPELSLSILGRALLAEGQEALISAQVALVSAARAWSVANPFLSGCSVRMSSWKRRFKDDLETERSEVRRRRSAGSWTRRALR